MLMSEVSGNVYKINEVNIQQAIKSKNWLGFIEKIAAQKLLHLCIYNCVYGSVHHTSGRRYLSRQ